MRIAAARMPLILIVIVVALVASSASMRGRIDGRQMRAARDPLPVGLERQSQLLVRNAHVAVSADRDRFRRHALDLLRHHPNVSGVAAVVDETVIAKAVVEPSDEHDVVLEANVGAATAPAAAAHAAASAAAHSPAAEA